METLPWNINLAHHLNVKYQLKWYPIVQFFVLLLFPFIVLLFCKQNKTYCQLFKFIPLYKLIWFNIYEKKIINRQFYLVKVKKQQQIHFFKQSRAYELGETSVNMQKIQMII